MHSFQPTTFNTFAEAYKHLAETLLDSPTAESRNAKTREICDAQFRILQPNTSLALVGSRLRYMFAEALWYAAGDYTTPWITNFSSFWPRIADADGLISSNYGQRIFRATKTFNTAFKMLCADPGSRQAICHINQSADIFATNKDIPCTMYLQFFIRKSQLHLSVHMRSNDIWRGLTYDAPNFFLFQQTMLYFLQSAGYDITLGSYTHHAGSFHVYETEVKQLQKYCLAPLTDIPLQLKAPLINLDGSPTTKALKFYNSTSEGAFDVSKFTKHFLTI